MNTTGNSSYGKSDPDFSPSAPRIKELRERTRWIEAIIAHRKLTPMAKLYGIHLALKYVNSKSGLGYPSQKAMAKDLGVSTKCVQQAQRALIAAGLLRLIKVHNPATSRTAQFALQLPEPPEGTFHPSGTSAPEPPEGTFHPSGTSAPLNQGREPRREPRREPTSETVTEGGANSERHQAASAARKSLKVARPIDPDWLLGDAERAVALKHGIPDEEIADQFASFKSFWIGEAKIGAQRAKKKNWMQTWENNCITRAAWQRRKEHERKSRGFDANGFPKARVL